MKLTEKSISDLNSNLTSKIYMTFGEPKVDLVQIAKKWIKFRFAENDATALLQFSAIKPMTSDKTIYLNSKRNKKSVILRYTPVENAIISEKLNRITAITDTNETRLVGYFQYINDELFLPFRNDGSPVHEYKTITDKKQTFFVDPNETTDIAGNVIYTTYNSPLAYRAVVLNVGKNTKNDSVNFAYRVADYDVNTTPLTGFENILGIDEKSLNEDMTITESENSCALRRMKLFDAAEHEGATILSDGNWIAAVCYTYRQCHVFGRLKPKVIPGTNEIDPNCNLEDWEGITPENKAMRDDPSLPWIKDGITDGHGHVFDKLSGESGQPRVSFGCETAWCNCGVLNRDGAWEPKDKTNMYFEYYNNGGKTPYVIFMDKSRGALYQYVRINRPTGSIVNFLNEDDKTDGGRFGNPPDRDQIEFFEFFCNVNPDFRTFVTEIDKKYFN